MLLELLEKQASNVKTAADQFREIADMLDKTGSVKEVSHLFQVKNPESSLNSVEKKSPGGVTALLNQTDESRVAAATGNCHVESSVTKEAGGFRVGYGFGRMRAGSKSKASRTLRRRSGIPEEGPLDDKAQKAADKVLGEQDGWTRAGYHVGKHRNKYIAGAGVTAAGGIAAKKVSDSKKKSIQKKAEAILERRLQKEAIGMKPIATALKSSAKEARKVGVPKPIKRVQAGPIKGFLGKTAAPKKDDPYAHLRGKTRRHTLGEMLGPEGNLPRVPVHPEEREAAYRETSRLAIPAGAIGGGMVGAGLAGSVKPSYALPGALIGAAGLGGLTWGTRELVAGSQHRKAKQEAYLMGRGYKNES